MKNYFVKDSFAAKVALCLVILLGPAIAGGAGIEMMWGVQLVAMGFYMIVSATIDKKVSKGEAS